ncbi:hypothetical protein EDB83DRAFT_2336985 [Lactarius deliciosus]|nr:hypothetical protein EDB83DRAFT_2336985 [Lactarius deliciosus]
MKLRFFFLFSFFFFFPFVSNQCRPQDSGCLVITFTRASFHRLYTSQHASIQSASPAAHACVRRSFCRRYFHCHHLVALGPTQMSFFHILLFSNSFRLGRTSCSRDYDDFAATSAPPHPHPLPVDPATLTWLRHPTDPVTTTTSTPPRCHHLDTALPLPRSRLDTAATASTLL